MYGSERLICPHCKNGTIHEWYNLHKFDNELRLNFMYGERLRDKIEPNDNVISVCNYCEEICLWVGGELQYPELDKSIPEPNDDLPENTRNIYYEARSIFNKSSRSSAALLRLALEELLGELGYSQGRLVDKINALIKEKGSNEELIIAAELIRLYGNSSAHSGFIDLNAEKEAAQQLFLILNLIGENQFTKQKRIDVLLQRLPNNKREEIDKKIKELNK